MSHSFKAPPASSFAAVKDLYPQRDDPYGYRYQKRSNTHDKSKHIPARRFNEQRYRRPSCKPPLRTTTTIRFEDSPIPHLAAQRHIRHLAQTLPLDFPKKSFRMKFPGAENELQMAELLVIFASEIRERRLAAEGREDDKDVKHEAYKPLSVPHPSRIPPPLGVVKKKIILNCDYFRY